MPSVVGCSPCVFVVRLGARASKLPSDSDDGFDSQRLLQFCGRQSYGNMNFMARKKKPKRFRAVQAVKELARERLGAPPVGKVVPHKKKNPEKHKATLGKLLGDAADRDF